MGGVTKTSRMLPLQTKEVRFKLTGGGQPIILNGSRTRSVNHSTSLFPTGDPFSDRRQSDRYRHWNRQRRYGMWRQCINVYRATVRPPEGDMPAPVMKAAEGEAKNATVSPTSSPFLALPRGVFEIQFCKEHPININHCAQMCKTHSCTCAHA
ncbi:hypothetical protein E2C01_012278 [Portunus trituberculatus]|uniref:Uncharacterized protein n=1 Tax=Portunus trituberculatus TaxID=210409 RepID=A0A5B7DE69_PORTR|nr:hypothetical protein [Portunus trituberculatus]